MRQFLLDMARGERRGPMARLVKLTLLPLAWGYGLALRVRTGLYALGMLPVADLGVPVISVGNITAGGTGKTPFVEWLARHLTERGRRVAMLSRGHGPQIPLPDGRTVNDEYLVLAANLPQTPHLLGKDRASNGRRAVDELGADCLLLDDGFQHWAVKRDLDIVVVDALCPFGNGGLLPAGILREPPGALRRAHLIVLSRADQCAPERLSELTARLKALAPQAGIVTTRHAPIGLESLSGGSAARLDSLRGRRAFAFCGLGNPAAFEATLVLLGAQVAGRRRFPDHHLYDAADLEIVAELAAQAHAELVVTTQKDAVKLQGGQKPGFSEKPGFYWLRIALEVTGGADALTTAVGRVLTPGR